MLFAAIAAQLPCSSLDPRDKNKHPETLTSQIDKFHHALH
jgi:hypothetical protein